MMEYVAWITKNRRGVIVRCLGLEGIRKQLHDAPVNHCLTFEQVGYEITETYHIPAGEFDTITNCKYTVPGFQDIGKLYAILVEMMDAGKSPESRIEEIFTSFLSDEISRFSTDLYYQNPDYLLWCLKSGEILMD